MRTLRGTRKEGTRINRRHRRSSSISRQQPRNPHHLQIHRRKPHQGRNRGSRLRILRNFLVIIFKFTSTPLSYSPPIPGGGRLKGSASVGPFAEILRRSKSVPKSGLRIKTLALSGISRQSFFCQGPISRGLTSEGSTQGAA